MTNYENLSNCWVEINTKTILDNKHSVQEHIRNGCKICCIVKADAYGHGAIEVAKLFEQDGVDYFGVANLLEAIDLREGGIKTPILILGYTNPKGVSLLAKYDITQAVFSYEYAEQLSNNLSNGEHIKIHIKINSGMNRIGFKPSDESLEEIVKITKNEKLDVEGIFTHFYNATNKEKTEKQFELFTSFINKLNNCGVSFNIRHCCNSVAAVDYPEMQLDMVRVGATLYGIKVTGTVHVKEAMSLKAYIGQIFKITKGETVSYGALFKAEKDMKIAAITAGYADGILRSNRETLKVTVNGKPCKVLGTICMDQLMVDVTDIDCDIDDVVTIYGDGGVSMHETAINNSTIAYEIMCNVGKRVKRIYR